MNVFKMTSFALCAILAAGCSSTSNESKPATSTDGGGQGKQDGAPSGDSGVAGAKLRWRVTPLSNPNADAPPVGIPGVHVCVDAHPEIQCVDTDADGYFTLEHLPQDSDIVLTLVKDGYVSALKPIETSNIDMDAVQSPIQLTTPAQGPTNLGFTPDGTKGAISFFSVSVTGTKLNPTPGVTTVLDPGGAKGPYYFTDAGVFDPALKATTSFGGAYFDVPPGDDYKLSFTAPAGLTCRGISAPFGGWGFPVSNEAAVTFPVKAGYVTGLVGVLCTGTPTTVDAGSDADASRSDAGPTDAGPGGAKDGG